MATCLGVGLLGLGTVGSGVYRLLQSPLRSKGYTYSIHGILIKHEKKKRIGINQDLLTTDPEKILGDPRINIIVEAIGGLEPAREYIIKAMKRKKQVVTANKLLLATHGRELLKIADEEGVSLLFEASVCGGIPILRTLKDSLKNCPLEEIWGILNGTSNYILTGMTKKGLTMESVLEEAKALGYAEADPRADLSGDDAKCKLAILASIVFGSPITLSEIPGQGIEKVHLLDIQLALDMGYVMKLLAYAGKNKEGLSLHVEPYLVYREHPLALIEGVTNAVFLKGGDLGNLTFSGPGAGMMPTAYSVVADIINIPFTKSIQNCSCYQDLHVLDSGRVASPFFLRFHHYLESPLLLLKEDLPVIDYIEDKRGLGMIMDSYPKEKLLSSLKEKGIDSYLAALYRVKGVEE